VIPSRDQECANTRAAHRTCDIPPIDFDHVAFDQLEKRGIQDWCQVADGLILAVIESLPM
jgi:hypothetical protein